MARYKHVVIDGKRIPEHRAVWERVNGPIPDGYVIHHINGDGHDNRPENLMMLTKSQHQQLHADLRRIGEDTVDPTNPDVAKCRANSKAYAVTHKEQIAARKKTYIANNREILAAKRAIYNQKHGDIKQAYRVRNKDKIAAQVHDYYMRHREETLARQHIYQQEHKDHRSIMAKMRYAKKKDIISAKHKIYYETNKEEFLSKQKAYRDAHRDEINARARAAWNANKALANARHNLLRAKRKGYSPDAILRLQQIYDLEKSKTK